MVFLNLIVKKIDPSNIQTFMQAWMKQVCKDFRIVFIQNEKTSIEEKQAISYSFGFVKNIGSINNIFVVSSEDEIPEAAQTKFLDDTSVLPNDKMEVMKLISIYQKNIKPIIPKKHPTRPKCDKKIEKKDIRNKNIQKVFFKIIVPNYNNMPYIKKCLDSILDQTFQDFIIIVVDDLSTDGSDKLAQLYAKRHQDKIVFLKLKKKGYAGACRNAGLDYKIDSSYTWFIDSDDWFYDREVLEKVHMAIVKNQYPKILRCPLFHFLGEGSKNNRIDVLPHGKMNMLVFGCGPSRNCIKSQYMKTFVENRAKSNDVVWFMRIIDQMTDSDISEVKFPCQVYNRVSITSCQNNIDVMLDEKVITDCKLLAEDLKKEVFTSKECIEFQRRKIFEREHLFKKKISVEQLLANAYVISIDQKRYRDFKQIFDHAKLLPYPALHHGSTIDGLSGVQNCTCSHIQAVEKAKKNKLPWICIFEDDAFPCADIATKLSKYLNSIPYDANLVLLGWSNYCRSKNQKFNAPFNRIQQPDISGSHAYILFENGYDQYLDFFKKNPFKTADNMIFSVVSPSYILNYPLFIQYSNTPSMNGHTGYIFYGDNKTPPRGFLTMKQLLKQ